MQDADRRTMWMIAFGFASVYIIWGSTYLAIRFAVETMPPLLMTGVRFFVGGIIMYGWMRLRGKPKPTWVQWKSAALAGTLMMCMATGLVAWAEQTVPSGLAALLVGAVPFWIVLFDWARPGGLRPKAIVVGGLVVGFAGLAVLVGPQEMLGGGAVDLIGAIVIVVATVFWAAGSIYSRYAPHPESRTLTAAMQMIGGGIALLIFGSAVGEWSGFDIAAVSMRSFWGFAYLTTIGSLAFAAYTYILKASTPAKVATYAYVNPVIAVILGIVMADEVFSQRTGIAMALIVVAVFLITTFRRQPAKTTEEPAICAGTALMPSPSPSQKPAESCRG